MFGCLYPVTMEILLFLFSGYFGCMTKMLLGFRLIVCRFFVRSLFSLSWASSSHRFELLCIVFLSWIWLSGRLHWTIFFEGVSSLLFYFEVPLIVVFFPYLSIDDCWRFCWEWSCFLDSGGHLWICSIVGLHRFDILMLCLRYLWTIVMHHVMPHRVVVSRFVSETTGWNNEINVTLERKRQNTMITFAKWTAMV